MRLPCSRRLGALALAFLAILAAGACAPGRTAPAEPPPPPPTRPVTGTVIVGARVLDGTGAPARLADVRVSEGRVAAIGEIRPWPRDTVVDGAGLVLAPGFIDTHSHHDRGLLEIPDALGAVSQGITTIVVGNDGGSPFPLADFFRSVADSGVAVNVASYAGHGTIRRHVMGDDFRREATPGEVDAMRRLLRRELDAGALGLSTGLEYDPGIYSSTDEVIALAREAAAAGGRYISHMRSEDRALWEAVDETIRIGREADIPVQISHMKLAMKSLWGRADELIARLDRARAAGVDITADVYPYTYWQSTMTVLFPERDFHDRAAAEFALRELAPPEGMLIARYEPEPAYEGRTLAEVARERGEDPVTAYMALVQRAVAADAAESIIATSMREDDVVRLLRWPHTNVSSDGALAGAHPRGFGAFTRVLGPMVRDGHLSLEEAVRKMTALAAEHVGLGGRGVLRVGAAADLVLFDPASVVDRAAPAAPRATSEGIRAVWVNGDVVYRDGATTPARPGRVLRRADVHVLPAGASSSAGTGADAVVRAVLESEARRTLAVLRLPLLVDSGAVGDVNVTRIAHELGLSVGHWSVAFRCETLPGRCERLAPYGRWVSVRGVYPPDERARAPGLRDTTILPANAWLVDLDTREMQGDLGVNMGRRLVLVPESDGGWRIMADRVTRIT